MFNRIVDDIDENFKTKKYDFVRLFCKKNCLFIINNVFYVKKCFYNFLSFNQFQINDCFLFIIKNDFFIDFNDIEVIFWCNLYFVQLKNSIICFLINFDIFRMWHERFNYLNNQNVINLIRNVDIDLFKFFSKNFVFFMTKKLINRNHIKIKLHQIDIKLILFIKI